MYRGTLFALVLLSAFGPASLSALDRIVVDPMLVSDASPDTVAALDTALPRAAEWLNRTYGESIHVQMAPPGAAGSGAQRSDSTGYHLQLILSGSGADQAIVVTLRRGPDDPSPQSFPVLSRFGSALELELADMIFYEYRSMKGLPQPDQPSPALVASIGPSMLSSADLPYPVELRPMSVAALAGSHLVLGTTIAAVELDRYFREVGKPGRELYAERNIPYAYQVIASPAGTLVTYGTTGGQVYLIHGDGSAPSAIRTGFDLPPAAAILNDGSVVLVDAMHHRAVRIVGRVQHPVNIIPGPNTYVTSVAAGPDDTLWVWDPVEGRAHIFTADGKKIGAFIPLLDTAMRRSVKMIKVLSNGSVLLLGNSDLWKTDRLGRPLWHLGELPHPEQADFTYINSMDVDESRSLIYLANQIAGRVYVLCDVADAAARGSSDAFRDRLVALNHRLASAPDDLTALRERAQLAESVKSYAFASASWQAVLDVAPDDAEAARGYSRAEVAVLTERARQAAARAVGLLTRLGPESARISYQTAVQLYEKTIARAPSDAGLKRELDRLKQQFDEAASGVKRAPSVKVTATDFPPLFPALIRYYQDHHVWYVTVRNDGSARVTNLTVQVSMRYLDYPVTSLPVGSVDSGATAKIPVPLTLSQSVLGLQEDLPVQVSYVVSYEPSAAAGTDGGSTAKVEGTASATIHRNSALTWDNTAKFAAFITPNDEVISNFALAASDPEGLFPDWQLPGRFLRAAKILDTLGAMGMRYVEDPASPISRVLGKPETIDTVRFPRTTIRVRSGDCDDTTALLASCLEAAGIPTAIMTSPGHIFLAFDTGEPAGYAWMYRSDEFTELTKNGTVWIPLESTVMSRGFGESWHAASRIVAQYGPSGGLEFLPTAEEQAIYPPIPLPALPVEIAAPTGPQVMALFSSTEKAIGDGLYAADAQALAARAKEAADGRSAASALNRLGILQARFGRTEAAAESFRRAVSRDADYYPAYLNLGQARLLAGDLSGAQTALAAAGRMRPDDPLLLVLRSRVASARGDAKRAEALLAEAAQKDPAAASFSAEPVPGKRASGAGGRGADASAGGRAIWLSPDR